LGLVSAQAPQQPLIKVIGIEQDHLVAEGDRPDHVQFVENLAPHLPYRDRLFLGEQGQVGGKTGWEAGESSESRDHTITGLIDCQLTLLDVAKKLRELVGALSWLPPQLPLQLAAAVDHLVEMTRFGRQVIDNLLQQGGRRRMSGLIRIQHDLPQAVEMVGKS
jgi:hypothetical protein